jgi:hypothetical protein
MSRERSWCLTVQTSRGAGDQRRLPRRSGSSLSGLAGIVVGMFLAWLLIATTPQTGAHGTGLRRASRPHDGGPVCAEHGPGSQR